MMTTNFSETKKQGRNKGFKIWGGGEQGFWPEYLPMPPSVRTLSMLLD